MAVCLETAPSQQCRLVDSCTPVLGCITEGETDARSSLVRVMGPATLVVALSISAVPTAAQSVNELLAADIEDGAATVWYLGHAGWAVKTRDHLVIFDYWEFLKPPRQESLANGFIGAAEIADQRTIVFVAHQPADHCDPKTFQWADTVPDITYAFGWKSSQRA